ncbi:MAG: hypothetical protein AMXMBFR4_29880 [Candidatus Hydrogenedentota bacterium]
MSKRLILTGGSGFVAAGIVRAAVQEWEVHAVSRRTAPESLPNLTWHTLNAEDPDAFHELFHHLEPAAVIHAAAIADIDYCQAHPDEAERVNHMMARDLAEMCWDHDTRFVFLSTDTVFDGERGDYIETDPPRPVNCYGETKVRAEQAIRGFGGNYVIARVALVMGLPLWGHGNSFVSRMKSVLEAGRQLTVPKDEIRTPIDVVTLGRALAELAGNDHRGVIHLSGNDKLNRYDMMVGIAHRLGLPDALIVRHDPTVIPDRAPRPRDASLCNAKAREVLDTPMRNFDEGLELVLAAAGQGKRA